MCRYRNNHIEINKNCYDFEFDIRTVVQHQNNYIVLLSIPFNETEINNIYCLDSQANLVWRSEDLRTHFPELKNWLPYEQMGISDGTIFASDFYGRNFKINASNGRIQGFDVVK